MKCYICPRITWMFSVYSEMPSKRTLTSRRKKKITLMVLMNSSNVKALMPYVIHVLIYKPYSLSSSSIYTDT